MKKFIRPVCILLCILLCTSVLLSAGYAVHEHTCIGEDCRICQDISLQKEIFRLALLSLFSSAFALSFVQLMCFVNSLGGKSKGAKSLVADKVKLTA